MAPAQQEFSHRAVLLDIMGKLTESSNIIAVSLPLKLTCLKWVEVYLQSFHVYLWMNANKVALRVIYMSVKESNFAF
jgi:hypothetical protein